MFFILTNIYICIHKRIRLQLYWIRKMKKQKQKEYSVETINLLIDHSQSSKIFLDSHTLIYVIHITYTALFYIFACTSSSPFLLPLQSLSSLHRLYFAVSSVYCTPFRFSWVFVKKTRLLDVGRRTHEWERDREPNRLKSNRVPGRKNRFEIRYNVWRSLYHWYQLLELGGAICDMDELIIKYDYF